MKTKILVAALIGCFSLPALAADWRVITTTAATGDTIELNLESVEYIKNDAGTPIVLVYMGRFTESKRNITFVQYGVKLTDCALGYGQLLARPVGLKVVELPFVLEGGTVAAGLADFICGIHKTVLKKLSEESGGTRSNPRAVGSTT